MSSTPTPAPPRWLAMLCLATSMALVGSYVAASKPLALIFPILLLPWLRFGIGALAMLHWLPKPASEPVLSRRTRGLLFLESLLGNFLFTFFMVSGMSLTSAVSAGVIMAAIPAAVAVLSRLFLKECIHARTALAIAMAIAGIVLLAVTGHNPDAASPAGTQDAGNRAWLGKLLLLAAVVCEASYAVIGKSLTGSVGPRRITAIINLWGLVLSTPMGLYAAWHFDFAAVTPGGWLMLALYALAASVWTVWLWMTGLRTIPASQAGVFTVFLPVSAALVGVLFLGEPLGGLQALALLLAIAGVLVGSINLAALRAIRSR